MVSCHKCEIPVFDIQKPYHNPNWYILIEGTRLLFEKLPPKNQDLALVSVWSFQTQFLVIYTVQLLDTTRNLTSGMYTLPVDTLPRILDQKVGGRYTSNHFSSSFHQSGCISSSQRCPWHMIHRISHSKSYYRKWNAPLGSIQKN